MQKISLEDPMRFLEHMPRNGDLELTLLKGHLPIEEMLQLLIDEKLQNPSAIEDARFTFHQRLCLAKVFYLGKHLEWAWTAAQKLNAVRNRLAHTLEANEIQSKIEEFVTLVEQEQGQPETELLSPTYGRLHWALFKVYSRLLACLRVQPTLVYTILGSISDSTVQRTTSDLGKA
jgi:hypothetical protein